MDVSGKNHNYPVISWILIFIIVILLIDFQAISLLPIVNIIKRNYRILPESQYKLKPFSLITHEKVTIKKSRKANLFLPIYSPIYLQPIRNELN